MSQEQPIIGYQSIVDGNSADLNVLRGLFETQGWAFLQLSGQTTSTFFGPATNQLEAFFQGPRDSTRYSAPPFGVRDTDYKTSLTCPTGTELEDSIDKMLPDNETNNQQDLRAAVKTLAKKLDQVLLSIVQATSHSFFGKSPKELGKALQLPLLDQTTNHESSEDGKGMTNCKKESDQSATFALFDAAYYKNNEEATKHDDYSLPPWRFYGQVPRKGHRMPKKAKVDDSQGGNCAEHYDPGLYSLWIGETQPGLKLQDAKGHWVAPRPDCLILWLGQAAQQANNAFVPAMHRVDKPKGNTLPRLSIWSELCTRDQVLSPNGSTKFVSADVIEVSNARYVSSHDDDDDDDGKLRVRVEGGNLEKALETVASILRMPISKVMLSPVFDDDGFVVRTTSGFSMPPKIKAKSGRS